MSVGEKRKRNEKNKKLNFCFALFPQSPRRSLFHSFTLRPHRIHKNKAKSFSAHMSGSDFLSFISENKLFITIKNGN
jgi:hypothetical protein